MYSLLEQSNPLCRLMITNLISYVRSTDSADSDFRHSNIYTHHSKEHFTNLVYILDIDVKDNQIDIYY